MQQSHNRWATRGSESQGPIIERLLQYASWLRQGCSTLEKGRGHRVDAARPEESGSKRLPKRLADHGISAALDCVGLVLFGGALGGAFRDASGGAAWTASTGNRCSCRWMRFGTMRCTARLALRARDE